MTLEKMIYTGTSESQRRIHNWMTSAVPDFKLLWGDLTVRPGDLVLRSSEHGFLVEHTDPLVRQGFQELLEEKRKLINLLERTQEILTHQLGKCSTQKTTGCVLYFNHEGEHSKSFLRGISRDHSGRNNE